MLVFGHPHFLLLQSGPKWGIVARCEPPWPCGWLLHPGGENARRASDWDLPRKWHKANPRQAWQSELCLTFRFHCASPTSVNPPQLHPPQKPCRNLKLREPRIVDFDQIPPVACPCGSAHRAFAEVADYPATVHRTEITGHAKPHYHQRLTETYYIIACEPGAQMQLDDQFVTVKPGMCILIPPGVVHCAIGHMTVLIFVIPKFDPADEVLV